MKNNYFLKFLAGISFIGAIIGIIAILKIPGNVGTIPLSISLVLGIILWLIAKNNNASTVFYKSCIILSISGLTIYFVFTKESEMTKDKQQIEQQKKNSKTIESTDELDKALDNL